MKELEVRFWGVRGSIPSPGADTQVVGGNTSCVEVTYGSERLILDAGSGLRGLGDKILAEAAASRSNAIRATILLSHLHWDHIMGLPFFAPLYRPEAELSFHCRELGVPLPALLTRQMSAPMFPVDFRNVPSRIRASSLSESGTMQLGPFRVDWDSVHHPDPVIAYRIEAGGRSVVYATDTEHGTDADARLVRLATNADLLIYDAQYTPEEYAGEVGPSRRGFGHSTYEAGAAIATQASARTLALFHHDPNRSDDAVRAIVSRAKRVFDGKVLAAREDLALSFEAHAAPTTAGTAAVL